MNPETISLIIKWGPLALVTLFFLWFFIVGVIRGSYKVLRRLIYVILYVVLIWIFINPITKIVLDINVTINGVQGVRNFVVQTISDNESINNFLRYSSDLKGIIIDSPEVIVSPVLFIVLVLVGLPLSFPVYWIYLIVYNLIARLVFKRRKYAVNENGDILRNEKGKKIKIKRKKHRLLGGLLRGAQGVALVCVVLLPVNFVNRIYNRAKNNAELKDGETLCDINSSLENYKDICGYIDLYNETIFAKLGGEKSLDKIVSDRLTTIEYNGQEFSLENELSYVAISAVLLNDSGVMELFKDGKFNIDEVDFSKINFDKLDLLIDYLFSSSLISELSQTGVKYVMNEVLNENLIDLLKDDDIVSKLEYRDDKEIKNELKNIVNIMKYAVEKNLDRTIINNRHDVVSIVDNVNANDVEELLNKILSLKILNRAMPSAIKAYGEKYGMQAPEIMTEELNGEISSLLGRAVKFVHTTEIAKMEDITKGDMLDNIINALFENGALKENSKESLAALLNDLNHSYLFKNVLSTQINEMIKGKDYKVDARVLKYVDSKEAWLKELEVLEKVYVLYDDYKETEEINYDNVTELLNGISGTKVLISVLPFAYDEILPKVGIKIDDGKLPIIDFDGDEEDSSKIAFYNTWENELAILKNIADSAEILELQSLEEIDLDLIKNEENVDALSTIMGDIYTSDLLKEPFVDFMKDTINEFVADYNVEFSTSELLSINTKEKWNNELTNISDALDVDLSVEDNVNSNNLKKIFNSIGNMELFKTKKVDILKYAVKESNFLTEEEYNSISWPNDSSQAEIDAFWDNETDVLVKIVDEKETVESLTSLTIETINVDVIGALINDVMKSNILKPIVVNKVSQLLLDNGVKDDRDVEGGSENLKISVGSVEDWVEELSSIKQMINISEETMDDVVNGEQKNAVEKMFASIETSELLKNTRANLLLKAIKTINITEVPSDVTVDVLKADSYLKYNDEKNVIIEVSKNKSAFDNLATMTLDTIDTNSIGGLLNTVTSSIIFKDYVVDKIKTVLVNNDVRDDRDGEAHTSTINLEASIAGVSDWKNELSIVKGMLNMDSSSFNSIVDGKTNVEKVFENIENSELLVNTRAHLLIKAIKIINLADVSVPSNVTISTLMGDDYKQYNNEKNVFITFAENKAAVEGLADITALTDENKKAMGAVLDAMKTSKILENKYIDTISKALSTIRSNEDLVSYGVSFNTNYLDIIWSSEYAQDGVTVTKNGEIDNLLVIKDNISTVADYKFSDLLSNKMIVITTIGKTLDAVSASYLLGEDQSVKIANTVISTITNNNITSVTKDSDKTWSDSFEEALSAY